MPTREMYYDVSPGAEHRDYAAVGQRIIYDRNGRSINVTGFRTRGPIMLCERYHYLMQIATWHPPEIVDKLPEDAHG